MAWVLTHGAGSNLAGSAADGSGRSLCLSDRHDRAALQICPPYRQSRPHGPPRPGDAARDREGLQNAVAALRKMVPGRGVSLGGHSYGGRQATMLSADQPGLVDGLLLLSYPLHPPRKPEQLRTQHLPKLRTPALFVHGTRDPFGTAEEVASALGLIPAKVCLLRIEGAGHDLGFKGELKLVPDVVSEFEKLFQQA